MKKNETPAFGEFMTREAERYGRAITIPEIETWMETFRRSTLEDFRLAWEQHRKDAKRGVYFPTINDLMRLLKVAGSETAARDWRCSEEVNGERCNFPGGINAGHGWQCSAHYRLHGTEGYSPKASLQIIEASRDYSPPKTPTDLMERGSAQREREGAMWRRTNAESIAHIHPARRAADPIRLARVEPDAPDAVAVADAHIAGADARRMREINEALALASEGADRG